MPARPFTCTLDLTTYNHPTPRPAVYHLVADIAYGEVTAVGHSFVNPFMFYLFNDDTLVASLNITPAIEKLAREGIHGPDL